jgi:hypothetical protein
VANWIAGTPMQNQQVESAILAFQADCNQRMASTNAANQPKQPLFHYTSENALSSIVESEQFWFSSTYHMDDTEELTFGFNTARALLMEAAASRAGLKRAFCEGCLEGDDLANIKRKMECYSISFGLRDVSQQWKKYGDGERGVAFGLAPVFFVPQPFKDPQNPEPDEVIFFGKVVYGDANARATHKIVIDAALALIDKATKSGWLRTGKDTEAFCRTLATAMYTEVLWNAITTKEDKWSDQSEIRLLARNFFPNPGLPIKGPEEKPRVEITQPLLRSSMVEVMVGPKAHADAAERVQAMLATHGMQNVAVTRAGTDS